LIEELVLHYTAQNKFLFQRRGVTYTGWRP